ncbi:Transcriptional regulator, LysR family [Granulibacter bethesdensis]|uniref:Transcriptional regulator, LysR family n=1 Tax=Granulibacter bethesdensis TaxID=364410 RepID=A0AAC9KB65_9PROT|nr:LysR family transcriptional regulator [Granulibacter bethesdensis]APH55094.1 Transcriptional regulator, LysR family [Granulibacter bethesdensis]APH62680.1 Transcriptional regulator, LysR family [Granulibacter bethesdensis]
MELRHIRYFLALVAEKNFTRAAGKVGIAQSPFSAQIRDLEREVGAQLFHRVPHGAELTAAGEAFLKGVEAMPTLAEHASRAARRAARGEEGALSIGFTASSAFNAIVPAAIRTFRTAYPTVEVRLEEANTARLAIGLREGSLDVVFLRPGMPGLNDFQLRSVSEEPMLAALPSSHPAAGDSEVALTQLADDPLLLFPRPVGPTLYDTIIGAFSAAGIEPRLGQTAPQITSIVNFVATGMGVTLVPASMAQVAIAGVVFRPVADTTLVARLALATRRGETSPIVRNFMARALV